MKRLIITTIILLIVTIGVTVVYFRNLNPGGQSTNLVMHTIPGNAAVIFEFNNDRGFYDIFHNDSLFTAIIGEENIGDFATLRRQLLLNHTLEQFFTGQNIFISLHPLTNKSVGILLTTTASHDFKIAAVDELAKQPHSGLVITTTNIEGKKVYVCYLSVLKKRFYFVNSDDDVFSGSFSKDLIVQSVQNNPKKNPLSFVLLPAQENSNSLANLYINYRQLNPLFGQLFDNKNTAIFKSFRLFPGLSALSLNFNSNAIMFSGLTDIEKDAPEAYLNVFINQQPVACDLKNIFPSSTAYSMTLGISNQVKFNSDLSNWQSKAGLQHEKDSLFRKIKTETGINLVAEFNQLLGNEFAVLTTKYEEKIALITVKNGSMLKPVLADLSTKQTDNTGLFNYNRVPFFLLGDAFNIFKRPYFMIIDNYLVLANTSNELASYYDSYINRKFLGKNSEYNHFDNLLAERSNVTWLINFKNAQPELKRDLSPLFLSAFENSKPGWTNFYGASYQFAASGKRFYTNFCMNLSIPDTTNSEKKADYK